MAPTSWAALDRDRVHDQKQHAQRLQVNPAGDRGVSDTVRRRRELKDEIDRYQAALAAMAGPPPATPVQQTADDEPPARSRRRDPKK